MMYLSTHLLHNAKLRRSFPHPVPQGAASSARGSVPHPESCGKEWFCYHSILLERVPAPLKRLAVGPILRTPPVRSDGRPAHGVLPTDAVIVQPHWHAANWTEDMLLAGSICHGCELALTSARRRSRQSALAGAWFWRPTGALSWRPSRGLVTISYLS